MTSYCYENDAFLGRRSSAPRENVCREPGYHAWEGRVRVGSPGAACTFADPDGQRIPRRRVTFGIARGYKRTHPEARGRARLSAGFLLDVNVLIAVAWPAHQAHQKAQQWVARHASDGWATCPFTETAFVRILSNPAFSPNALTPADAFSLLRANLGHPAHRFWADDIDFLRTVV